MRPANFPERKRQRQGKALENHFKRTMVMRSAESNKRIDAEVSTLSASMDMGDRSNLRSKKNRSNKSMGFR